MAHMLAAAGETAVQHRPAPLWRRLAALLYDLLFVALLCWLAAALMTLFGGGSAEVGTAASRTVLLGALLLNMLYFCLSWTRSGQTIGMKAWKLRLLRSDGQPLRWTQALLRLAVGPLTTLPLGMGWLWLLSDERKRPLHDIWSGSEMVRVP